jgi:hypothetical protein
MENTKITIVISITCLILFISLFGFIILRGNDIRNKTDNCISKGNNPVECNCAYTICDYSKLFYSINK